MKLLIKFPTRGRKGKFLSTLQKYHDHCKDIDNTVFLISLDEDDSEMNNDEVLNIWSPEYFKDLIGKIKFENT